MGEHGEAKASSPPEIDCCIVSLDIDENDRTGFLCARVRDVWFYVEMWAAEIKNKWLNKQYIALADATLVQRRSAELANEVAVQEVQAEREESSDADTEQGAVEPRDDDPKKVELQNAREGVKSQAESSETISPQNSNDDSGYASEHKSSSSDTKIPQHASSKAEADLRALLTSALEPSFASHAPPAPSASDHNDPPTLASWYNAPIHCLSLRATSTSSSLAAHARLDLDGQAYISRNLIPSMPLPGYLGSLKDIPFYSPDELSVLDTSHDIHAPLHPTLIQPHHSKEKLFLKIANEADAPSVKRELRILQYLARHDVYSAGIRAPRLAGLVGMPSTPTSTKRDSKSTSKARIMGFLMTLVPSPAKPLTHYMTPAVPAQKWERFAREAQEMVQILHDKGITWGDAKGDNFLVAGCADPEESGCEVREGVTERKEDGEEEQERDESDDGKGEVYIIDFGGGFTAGWVDEEMANTMKGDDAGTGRLVNGLVDPVNNVVGSEDETEAGEQVVDKDEQEEVKGAHDHSTTNRVLKRRRSDDAMTNEQDTGARKRPR